LALAENLFFPIATTPSGARCGVAAFISGTVYSGGATPGHARSNDLAGWSPGSALSSPAYCVNRK